MSRQIEIICLEDLASPNHIYRKFQELWDFTEIKKELIKIENRFQSQRIWHL